MKLSSYLLIEEIIEPEGNIGLSRDEMPQIDDLEALTSWLRGRYEFERTNKKADELKPTQNELDTDKANKIWNDGNAFDKPIIISLDGYILDGHHRWLAVKQNDPKAEMECILIGSNVKDALEILHGFSGSTVRDIDDKVVEKLTATFFKKYK